MNGIAERVAAGAAFLDEHDPDWWRADVERAIDLETLDLGYGSRCVLGQRCPFETDAPFSDQAAVLSGLSWDDEDNGAAIAIWAVQHGFDAGSEDSEASLTAEWRKVITERRSAS